MSILSSITYPCDHVGPSARCTVSHSHLLATPMRSARMHKCKCTRAHTISGQCPAGWMMVNNLCYSPSTTGRTTCTSSDCDQVAQRCGAQGARLPSKDELHAWLANGGKRTSTYGVTSTRQGSKHWLLNGVGDYGWHDWTCCDHPNRYYVCVKDHMANIPCEGAHFQCFQERAHHGHRLQAVGAKCKDLVRILQTHTSAQLGCSNWYDTLTLAEGPDQLATLRRDTKLNFVRPKGGNTVALESSFAACGSWGVAKAEKIYALLAFTTPSICLRPNRTPGTCISPCISCCNNAA